MFDTFDQAINVTHGLLIAAGREVDAGRWQGYATEGKPDLVTVEVLDHHFGCAVDRPDYRPDDLLDVLASEIQPNRDWADEHFEERVGGVPRNPDPSYVRWPWWRGQNVSKQAGEQFTHTYSERFWPREAGWSAREVPLTGFMEDEGRRRLEKGPMRGIRYDYGDLQDVVNLLVDEPHTRQAYLPIFFPEDTGAVHRGRTPCSLGYHFMLRDNMLCLWYDIRSCDFVRHFRDDIYLAVRLMLWMKTACMLRMAEVKVTDPRRGNLDNFWPRVKPGYFYFTAHSLHYHKGDEHHVRPPR